MLDERGDIARHRGVGVGGGVSGLVRVAEAAHVRDDHARSGGAQERGQAALALGRGRRHRWREAQLFAEQRQRPLEHRPRVIEVSVVPPPIESVPVQEDDRRTVTVVGVRDPSPVK